jgi:hypothetical protein
VQTTAGRAALVVRVNPVVLNAETLNDMVVVVPDGVFKGPRITAFGATAVGGLAWVKKGVCVPSIQFTVTEVEDPSPVKVIQP